MLADAAQDAVKKPQTRRVAAPSRGLIDRAKGWVLFTAIDGRTKSRARGNAPFEPRRQRGLILAALAPGLLLLLLTAAIFWRPMSAEPEPPGAIPIPLPAQTAVERERIQSIAVLREGLWEARLPPWSDVPLKGMARVSNPEVHADLTALIGEIAAFGDAIADRGPPNARRDSVFLSQIADFRSRVAAVDAKLHGMRSVTAYHLGLLSLWAGDAADAEPQFASAVDIARKTEPLDDVGKQRLDGIEASASYGLGLAEAGRGLWQKAIGDFDAALTAACRASADAGTNTQADSGFTLSRANLVPLDTRSIRNDRLIALLHARGAVAVTSPTCAQLLAPSPDAPSGDADAEARALFGSLPAAGDPTLAANLQLRAALMGEGDVVQRLSFDNADAEAQQAQSLAHAIAGLEIPADGAADGVDKSALTDLRHLSTLKTRLIAQLGSGTLTEPESDPSWTWSDPTLFANWKSAIASDLADNLLATADRVSGGNPGLSVALYNLILENRAWLPAGAVFNAWWRLNTGTSPGFVLTMLGIAAAISLILFLVLRRWRQTYRTTFESWHHADRQRAPEG